MGDHMNMDVGSGLYGGGATFADAIQGPADARWFKIWDYETGEFVTTGAASTDGNWVSADSLAQMELDSARYAVSSWGPESGQSEWLDFNATTGGQDSYVGLSDHHVPSQSDVTLDQLIDTDQLRSGDFVKVMVESGRGESGAQEFGWMAADALSDQAIDTGAFATNHQVWVDTWHRTPDDPEAQGVRGGWSSFQVTADADSGGAPSEADQQTFTLTEVTPSVEKSLLWDGVNTDALSDFLGQTQFDKGDSATIVNNLVKGYPDLVDETVELNPAVLTPTQNNAGVTEDGYTGPADDTIDAGTSYALHGAYIDGGKGTNTVEVAMKGPFAQPDQLLNIQKVQVHNEDNVYTDGAFDLNNSGRTNQDSVGYGELLDVADSNNSILDLSRADDLEQLVVTESSADTDQAGELQVVGIEGDATARLEGGFSQDVTLHYTGDVGEATNLALNVGDTGEAWSLDVAHNNSVLNIDSQSGENALSKADLGDGMLTELNITGDAALYLGSNLGGSFHDDRVATVDASANTGGVDLTLNNQPEVDFTGSAAGDTISATGNEQVSVASGEGDDQVVAEGKDIQVDSGAGNDHVTVAGNAGDSATQPSTSAVNLTFVLDNTGSLSSNQLADLQDASKGLLESYSGAGVDTAVRLVAFGGASETTTTYNGGADEWLSVGSATAQINALDASFTSTNFESALSTTEKLAPYYDGGDQNDPDKIGNKGSYNDSGDDRLVFISDGEPNEGATNYTAGDSDLRVDWSEFLKTNEIDADAVGVANATTSTLNPIAYDGANREDKDAITTQSDELGDVLLKQAGFEATGDRAQLDIDTGDGASTVQLGNANLAQGVTARAGSVIQGSDVQIRVAQASDLTQATLTGVTGVTLADTLTLTGNQFGQIGAAAFQAQDGGLGNTEKVHLKISEDTQLSQLANLAELSDAVQLTAEIAQGAELSLTAEELHSYFAANGIQVSDSAGQVVVTDAGLDFEVDQQGDYGNGGTLDGATQANVEVVRTIDGFSRPQKADYQDSLTIDSTGTGGVTVTANDVGLGDAETFDMDGGSLVLTGDQPITFDAHTAIHNPNFTVDASGLEAELNGFYIEDFQTITAADTVADQGQIIGNPDQAMRIDVDVSGVAAGVEKGTDKGTDNVYEDSSDTDIEVNKSGVTDKADLPSEYTANVGEAGNANGLKSSGVETYVVHTDSAANEFYVCDETKGVETLGLQGPGNITFSQVDWGTSFLLEGDGAADWNDLPKAAGNPNESDIGSVTANYFHEGATASFDINNQGTALGDSSKTDAEGNPIPRTLVVDAITANNASEVVLNIADGNAEIMDIGGSYLNADDTPDSGAGKAEGGVADITLNSANDVALHMDGSLTNDATDNQGNNNPEYDNTLETLNAEGVEGTAELVIEKNDTTGDDVDLSGVDVTGVDTATLQTNADLTLSYGQLEAMDLGVGFDAANTAMSEYATVNVGGLANEAFSVGDYPEGIEFGTVTIADQDEVTLSADADLSGVNKLVVQEGTTLNLTAAQYNQIDGVDTNDDSNIDTKIEVAGTGEQRGQVNITDLTQAETLYEEDGSWKAIDLSGVVASNTDTDDADAQGTITLGDALVNLGDFDNEVHANLASFDVDLAAGETLGVTTEAQAHARVINGADNTTVGFGMTDSGELTNRGGFDGAGDSGTPALNLADYTNVANLEVQEQLVEGQNVERLLANLESGTEVDILKEEQGTTETADVVNRDVVLESGATIEEASADQADVEKGDSLVFEDLKDASEVATLDMAMEGDVTVKGNIDLNQTNLATGGKGFQTLTLTSNGDNANVIGDPDQGDGDGAIEATGNDLLDVVVNANQDLTVNGPLVFSADANDGQGGATATLTVNQAGNVQIAQLDATNSEVTNLEVVHNGSGTLDVTGNSPAITGAGSVTLSGSGDMAFGTLDSDAGRNGNQTWAGVNGSNVNAIDASGLSGALDLGYVSGLNTGTDKAFTVTAGSGVTTLTLGSSEGHQSGNKLDAQDGKDDGLDGWKFDLSNGAAGSALTLTGDNTFNSGTLDVNVGDNGKLVVDGEVDITGLMKDGNSTFSLNDGGEIELTDGAYMAMTDTQFNAINANFTGAGTTLNVDMTDSSADEISDYRGHDEIVLEAYDYGSSAMNDTLTLTADQAANAYVVDGDGNRVQVNEDANGDYTGMPDSASDGDRAIQNGQFSPVSGTVNVEINGDDDVTGLHGVSSFNIDHATTSNLTVRNDQLDALSDNSTSFGTTSYDTPDDLDLLNGLTVVAEVQTGTDPGDSSIKQFTDYDISVAITRGNANDKNITQMDVSGHSAGIANTLNTAGTTGDQDSFSDLLSKSDSVEWTNVGSEISVEEGPLKATGSVSDTFVFGADPMTGGGSTYAGTSGPVSITGFEAGSADTDDVLDFSQINADGTLSKTDYTNGDGTGDFSGEVSLDGDNTGIHVIDTDGTDLGDSDNGETPISDFTVTSDIASFLNGESSGSTGFAASNNADALDYFVINDGDNPDAHVYRFQDGGDGTSIDADEVDYIGTVGIGSGDPLTAADDVAV